MNYKVGCVFLMVIVYMLPHAKIRRNDHREGASHFTKILVLRQMISGICSTQSSTASRIAAILLRSASVVNEWLIEIKNAKYKVTYSRFFIFNLFFKTRQLLLHHISENLY